MKKKSSFLIVYKSLPKKDRREFISLGWMMEHMPNLYKWCDKHLKCDTLPF